MKQLTNDIKKLKDQDLITILLYCLYKFSNDPQYSAISELAYALDKDSLYKLCVMFGGCTIKIPTLQEIKTFTKSMLVYQYVNSDGMQFTDACKLAGIDESNMDETINIYKMLEEIINTYEG